MFLSKCTKQIIQMNIFNNMHIGKCKKWLFYSKNIPVLEDFSIYPFVIEELTQSESC